MSKKNKNFIFEIKELITNLMNFCNNKVEISNDELSVLVDSSDIIKTLLFFKDNPSFSMTTLIDFTAVDFPNDQHRFLLVYNLLSVSKNLRIKIKTKITGDEPVSSIIDIIYLVIMVLRAILLFLYMIFFNPNPNSF